QRRNRAGGCWLQRIVRQLHLWYADQAHNALHGLRDGSLKLPPTCLFQPLLASLRHYSGITCSNHCGPTDISPVNRRACDAIKIKEIATPVAKSAMASPAVSRFSMWTMAIASSVQAACRSRPTHLTQFTLDWLIMMRCRRASSAFSRE